MERYHVSKAPVREALLILSSEGVLENIPRYGYRVVSFTRETVNNIMEFRSALEDHVLIKAFLSMRPEDLETLRAVIKRWIPGMTAMSGSDWDWNMDFHLKLAAMADNGKLYAALTTLSPQRWPRSAPRRTLSCLISPKHVSSPACPTGRNTALTISAL